MPQLGPAFLHQPLPPLSAISWRDFERWLIDGLSIMAPKSLREFGWRPSMRLRRIPKDGSLKSECVIERSILGELRISPNAVRGDHLPLAIEIDQSAVFETSVNLPAAAQRNVQEAVDHRLEALSPLPPSEVSFAIGKLRPAADDRFDAPVAIVRRSTLQSAIDDAKESNVTMVGAKADATGAFAYVFQDKKISNDQRRVVHPALALIASAVVLVIGADQYVDRRIATLDAQAQQLREAIIAEKAQAAFLKDAPADINLGLPNTELRTALSTLIERLPETAWIETIELSQDGVTASGFSPEDSAWPEGVADNLNATDRPSVNAFTLMMPREASP